MKPPDTGQFIYPMSPEHEQLLKLSGDTFSVCYLHTFLIPLVVSYMVQGKWYLRLNDVGTRAAKMAALGFVYDVENDKPDLCETKKYWERIFSSQVIWSEMFACCSRLPRALFSRLHDKAIIFKLGSEFRNGWYVNQRSLDSIQSNTTHFKKETKC